MEPELWSSNGLDLLPLTPCQHRHNPMLLSPAENPNKTAKRATFFWRVDPTFASWTLSTLARRAATGLTTPPEVLTAVETIREYLTASHPGCWPEIEKQARLGPIALPGGELLRTAVGFARLGFIPPWDGIERVAKEMGIEGEVLLSQNPPLSPAEPEGSGRGSGRSSKTVGNRKSNRDSVF